MVNCHNGESFLKETISSILNQTYKNWELIFWDNFSTDLSEKIVKSFKDSRIKYFKSNSFTSLYKARNLAINKCSGQYISFLDTDDMWISDKLEKQINFMEKNPNYEIIYTNYYVLTKNKKYVKYTSELSSGQITQKLLDNYSIGINTALLNKSVFDHYNFEKDLNIICDFDLFIKASQKFEIGYLKDPLTIYRVHENSYTAKNLKMYIHELTNWIKKNEIDLKNKNYVLTKLKFYIIKLRIKHLFRSLKLL